MLGLYVKLGIIFGTVYRETYRGLANFVEASGKNLYLLYIHLAIDISQDFSSPDR